jgi:virulence-associated protein VagC
VDSEFAEISFRNQRSRFLARGLATLDANSARDRIHQRQAVRLPKEFRMAGTEVRVRRVGRGVLLEPIDRDLKDIAAIFAEIDRMAVLTLSPVNGSSSPQCQGNGPFSTNDLPRHKRCNRSDQSARASGASPA